MRAGTIARSVPIINEAYSTCLTESRNLILFLLILTIFMLIGSGVLLFVSVRQRKRLAAVNRALGATGKTLESYVGYFLEMCSAYAGKLDSEKDLFRSDGRSGQDGKDGKICRRCKFRIFQCV